MQWLKNLFKPKGGIVESSYRKPNISEPVYAIVKALKQRPDTFIFSNEAGMTVVRDDITKEVFGYRVWVGRQLVTAPFDTTEDEDTFLYQQMEEVYRQKRQRMSKEKRDRVKRKYGVE